MNTNFTRKLTIASLAFAGVATSLGAFSAPSAAHADFSSRAGSGVLISTGGGASGQAATGTFRLTFNGQATGPISSEHGKDVATNGAEVFEDFETSEAQSADETKPACYLSYKLAR